MKKRTVPKFKNEDEERIPYQSFMKMMLAEKIKENLAAPGKISPQYKRAV